jgi:uncharacterized protein
MRGAEFARPEEGAARNPAVETELGPRETRLIYSATAQIGGRLAQIGARLVDAAAAATAERFFQSFAAQLASRTTAGSADAAPPAALAARPGLFGWLRSFLRQLRAR